MSKKVTKRSTKKIAKGARRGNTNSSRSIESKNFTFTSFGVDEPKFKEVAMRYLAYGKEVCPTTKKEHWQGFVVMNKKMILSTAIATINISCNHKCHVEIMRGNLKDNERYCSKEGKYTEHGDKPKMGARTDLIKIKNDIMQGKTNVLKLRQVDPMLYHQYGRTLEKLEDDKLMLNKRTEMTKGIWIWGKTGTGKTKKAYEYFNGDEEGELFVWTNDKGWWDGYRQQRVVLMDDYRGEIPYNDMLKLCDRYIHKVSRRGREPVVFTSELIIVTSSLHPKRVYKHRDEEDNIEQLLRRFEVIHLE